MINVVGRATSGGSIGVAYGSRVRDREGVDALRWFVRLVGRTVVAFAVLATVFLVGMRAKTPAVVNRVRRFNRAVTNPRVLRSAGEPGASASVIRHVGRVSGRSYETRWVPSPLVTPS
jgi:hypothetical protein